MDVKQIKHELRLSKVTVANKRKAVWVKCLGGSPFAKDEKGAWIPHGVRILTVCYGRTFWAETKVEQGSGKNVAYYRLINVETSEITDWVTNPSEAMRIAQLTNASYPEGYNGRLQFAIGYDSLQDRIREEFGDILTDTPAFDGGISSSWEITTRAASRKRCSEEVGLVPSDDVNVSDKKVCMAAEDDERELAVVASLTDLDYHEMNTFVHNCSEAVAHKDDQIEPMDLGEPTEDIDYSFSLSKVDSLLSNSSTVYRSRSQSSMVEWDLALSGDYLSLHGMVESSI